MYPFDDILDFGAVTDVVLLVPSSSKVSNARISWSCMRVKFVLLSKASKPASRGGACRWMAALEPVSSDMSVHHVFMASAPPPQEGWQGRWLAQPRRCLLLHSWPIDVVHAADRRQKTATTLLE